MPCRGFKDVAFHYTWCCYVLKVTLLFESLPVNLGEPHVLLIHSWPNVDICIFSNSLPSTFKTAHHRSSSVINVAHYRLLQLSSECILNKTWGGMLSKALHLGKSLDEFKSETRRKISHCAVILLPTGIMKVMHTHYYFYFISNNHIFSVPFFHMQFFFWMKELSKDFTHFRIPLM